MSRSRTRSLLGFNSKRSSLLFGGGDIQESHEEKEAHKLIPMHQTLQGDALSAPWTPFGHLKQPLTVPTTGGPCLEPHQATQGPMSDITATTQAARSVQDPNAADLPLLLISVHYFTDQCPTYAQRSPIDVRGQNGNRMSSRPSSYVENNHGRRFGQGHRIASDPALYGQNSQGVYPSQGYQQSYDTVASASVNGSGGTDPWGNSTDPSSENSSIDRVQQAQKPDLSEQYGFSGFGGAPQYQGPILEEHGQDSPGYGQPGYGQSHTTAGGGFPFQGNDVPPPPPPPHQLSPKQNTPRTPIKLGGSAVPAQASPPPLASSEKRRSWLKRRFSKG
ncbi:MAG: hypothetical protein Q9191_001033 [Dirinaria sp. TL-2023a]